MTDAPLPSILITGASGFVGQQLLEALREHFRIVALDWRPPDPGAQPPHPNVHWVQADIVDRDTMLRLARARDEPVQPQLLIHLAAHFEFEQLDTKPYWQTNVEGLRNVLDAAVEAGIPRVIFASSLAASKFPRPEGALTEATPPDGEHIYAETKRIGEAMLREYEGRLKSVVVRFAAMYSDYCEYPPLFKFLETWLSRAWNQRMLGGHGRSAIPYLHVRDATRFLRAVIVRFDELDDGEIVIASPDGCTSHRELFEVATRAYFGFGVRPIYIPRLLVGPGIWLRWIWGRMIGDPPFERPWMAAYVDAEMRVDASRTRERLGWAPRPRLGILERLPLLIENYRSYPAEWQHRNQGALHKTRLGSNLVVHGLIQRHQGEIARRLSEALQKRSHDLVSYQRLGEGEHAWNHKMALSQLMHAVRTRERKPFVDYCADLAHRRHDQGFTAEELTTALRTLAEIVLAVLRQDPAASEVEASLHRDVEVTVRFALDEVEEIYDELESRRSFVLSLLGPGEPPPEPEGQAQHHAIAHSGERDDPGLAEGG